MWWGADQPAQACLKKDVAGKGGCRVGGNVVQCIHSVSQALSGRLTRSDAPPREGLGTLG
jgi:hypothetical protein